MPRSNTELIRSQALLTLLSSRSTVELTDPATALERFETIFNTNYGALAAEFIGDFLVVGEGNFPAFPPGTAADFPLVIVYNTANEQLQEVFRLPFPEGAASSVVISPNPCRPFIAVTLIREDNTTQLLLYRLNQDGTLTQVNSFLLNGLPGAIVQFGVTVEGAIGFSSDGRYLLTFFTTGVTEEGIVTSTSLAIFRVGREGQLQLVTTAPLPTVGGFGFNIQPIAIFRKISDHKHRYAIILGLNVVSVDPFSPNAVSLLTSFIFNSCEETVRQTGQQTLNQAIIAYDANPELDRVLVATRQADIGDVTVLQIPSPATNNFVPQPGSELRLYAFCARAKADALAFLKGHNTDARSAGLRWSHDGKRVALTQAPLAFVPAPVRTETELIEGVTFSGAYLTTLSYDRKDDSLHYEDVKPVSPFAFALAWKECDHLLAVAGVPIPPVFFGGEEPVQGSGLRDVQLYAVSSNEKHHKH